MVAHHGKVLMRLWFIFGLLLLAAAPKAPRLDLHEEPPISPIHAAPRARVIEGFLTTVYNERILCVFADSVLFLAASALVCGGSHPAGGRRAKGQFRV